MSVQSAIRTEFLVLRKTPYAESSLILAGLSPDVGQVHFIVRGGRRIERRSLPVADLFRALSVEYVPGRSELYTWRRAEVVADWGGVAHVMPAYEAACRLAAFTLANLPSHAPCPRYYRALVTALQRLADSANRPSAAVATAEVGTGLVYLDENGLLPPYDDDDANRQRRDLLVAMGEGLTPPPALRDAEWRQVRDWTFELLRRAETRLP
ncbi:MAG: DNA repair protein RecO [Lentisphaerae bacterium ADurb.BinA184]|nr:MAG: DNA repair protein RecO [Lentisphaerae bacterium ADurb.BinA184]